MAASADQGIIIAKRSVSLSKTYPIIGVGLAILSVILARVPDLVPTQSLTNSTTKGPSLSSVSYISIPLEVISAIVFATPVLLLYVYDKNNGVLEYFLSLGMDQGTIYKHYLKAALILSSIILAFEVGANIVSSLALSGVANFARDAIIPIIGVLIAYPVVAFTTIAMIAFSSLQKQRVGSNQPLGLTLGIGAVMPTYIAPLIDPGLAPTIDLAVAAIMVAIAAVFFVLSSRLIKREKLLP
jgi:hypothetical protein